jgi:uncharacterized protein YbaP (TraB family)
MRFAIGLCLLLSAATTVHAAGAPFLWQIDGPRAKHYLLGSVHLLPESSKQLPAEISDAYDAADGLIFEADIDQLSAPETGLALLAAAKSPKGLRSELDAATYAELGKKLAEASLPAQLCDTYRAWFCALSMEIAEYRKAGFSGDYGLDHQIYEAGKTDGKPLHALETVAQQVGLFVDMPAALSKQFLMSELAIGEGLESPAAVYRAWKNNDVEAFAANVADLKVRFPEVYARLLGNRNRAWLPRLKPWLDGDKPQLIVVGAAHLVGPEGLLAQLRARGYRVQPYQSAEPQVVTLKSGPPRVVMQVPLAIASAR